jgi:hypothetical protein
MCYFSGYPHRIVCEEYHLPYLPMVANHAKAGFTEEENNRSGGKTEHGVFKYQKPERGGS